MESATDEGLFYDFRPISFSDPREIPHAPVPFPAAVDLSYSNSPPHDRMNHFSLSSDFLSVEEGEKDYMSLEDSNTGFFIEEDSKISPSFDLKEKDDSNDEKVAFIGENVIDDAGSLEEWARNFIKCVCLTQRTEKNPHFILI